MTVIVHRTRLQAGRPNKRCKSDAAVKDANDDDGVGGAAADDQRVNHVADEEVDPVGIVDDRPVGDGAAAAATAAGNTDGTNPDYTLGFSAIPYVKKVGSGIRKIALADGGLPMFTVVLVLMGLFMPSLMHASYPTESVEVLSWTAGKVMSSYEEAGIYGGKGAPFDVVYLVLDGRYTIGKLLEHLKRAAIKAGEDFDKPAWTWVLNMMMGLQKLDQPDLGHYVMHQVFRDVLATTRFGEMFQLVIAPGEADPQCAAIACVERIRDPTAAVFFVSADSDLALYTLLTQSHGIIFLGKTFLRDGAARFFTLEQLHEALGGTMSIGQLLLEAALDNDAVRDARIGLRRGFSMASLHPAWKACLRNGALTFKGIFTSLSSGTLQENLKLFALARWGATYLLCSRVINVFSFEVTTLSQLLLGLAGAAAALYAPGGFLRHVIDTCNGDGGYEAAVNDDPPLSTFLGASKKNVKDYVEGRINPCLLLPYMPIINCATFVALVPFTTSWGAGIAVLVLHCLPVAGQAYMKKLRADRMELVRKAPKTAAANRMLLMSDAELVAWSYRLCELRMLKTTAEERSNSMTLANNNYYEKRKALGLPAQSEERRQNISNAQISAATMLDVKALACAEKIRQKHRGQIYKCPEATGPQMKGPFYDNTKPPYKDFYFRYKELTETPKPSIPDTQKVAIQKRKDNATTYVKENPVDFKKMVDDNSIEALAWGCVSQMAQTKRANKAAKAEKDAKKAAPAAAAGQKKDNTLVAEQPKKNIVMKQLTLTDMMGKKTDTTASVVAATKKK